MSEERIISLRNFLSELNQGNTTKGEVPNSARTHGQVLLITASDYLDSLVMGDPSLTVSQVREIYRQAVIDYSRFRETHPLFTLDEIIIERAEALGIDPETGEDLTEQTSR